MSHSLRMPTTTAVDIARGGAVTADVYADAIYPEQSIYGNAELVRRMSERTGEPMSPDTSNSLLDASPEAVMAWMMEGIDGFAYSADSTAVDIGLLEVGPDIDSETLQGFAAAGMELEAFQDAPDTTSPTSGPASIAADLYPLQCESHLSEAASDQEAVCVYGELDNMSVGAILARSGQLIENVGSALETVQDKMIDRHLSLKDSKELREQILEGLLTHLSTALQIALGGLIGGAVSHLTSLAGGAAGPYIKYIVSLLTKTLNVSIEKEMLSWSAVEPGDMASNDQLYDFFEMFRNGHTTGMTTGVTTALEEGVDSSRAIGVVLEALVSQQDAYISAMRVAALDGFLSAAAHTTATERPESEGGMVSTELYALEVVPCDDPREGIREIKLPEALPDSLHDEYAGQSTLSARPLLLVSDSWLGDFVRAEYHTGTCQVRGIGTVDLCAYKRPAMHDLVLAMMPDSVDEFHEALGSGHTPIQQGHYYRTDAPFPQDDHPDVQRVREIGEEAVRRWFLFSIEKLGGTQRPLSHLTRKVVFH